MLSWYTIPYPTLPYPTLPYPTLPYPTLPYPTLPYPALQYATCAYYNIPCNRQTSARLLCIRCSSWIIMLIFACF